MLKRLIPFLLLLVVVVTTIPSTSSKAQEMEEVETQDESIEFTVANSKLRASNIILGTGWTFNNDRCSFTIDFLRVSTGSGTVTLQRKVSYSWINYKSIDIQFKNVYSASAGIIVSNLPAGEYRLEFDITANNISEVLYTWEKTLY